MLIEAHGVNGAISFDGVIVTITRRTLLARMSQGRSTKQIPVRQIQAVQVKPAGLLTNGFIQFTVPGELSQRTLHGHRTFDAASDENAVIFTRAQAVAFEQLAQQVSTAVALGGAGYPPPAVPLTSMPAPTAAEEVDDLPSQLSELARLHQAGLLSDAEFAAAKARILGHLT